MKKIFFILSFAFLITPKVFGQAQVDIPFYATDGLYTITLPVGLDLIWHLMVVEKYYTH